MASGRSRFRIATTATVSLSSPRRSFSIILLLPELQATSRIFRSVSLVSLLFDFTNVPRKDGVWHILYSVHSSFQELLTYVSHLRPKIVRPSEQSQEKGRMDGFVELNRRREMQLVELNIEQTNEDRPTKKTKIREKKKQID